MTLVDLFRRRRIGPILMSAFGLVALCLLAAAAVKIYNGVYEAKEIQAQLHAALNYARPVASQARLLQERTGKWPVSLAEIEAAKAKAPPEIARVELRKDGEVRVVFASPPSLASSTLVLRVIVRGGEHFLECRGEGEFKGALPSACRPGAEAERLSWPPESGKPA